MPMGCHFRDCKALLVTSLTHTSYAISSSLVYLAILLLQDLTAIGITQPGVRKRLTSEISKLTIGDAIPHMIPVHCSLCLLSPMNALDAPAEEFPDLSLLINRSHRSGICNFRHSYSWNSNYHKLFGILKLLIIFWLHSINEKLLIGKFDIFVVCV